MNCQCGKPVLEDFKLCVDCLRQRLPPPTFFERRNDQPPPEVKEKKIQYQDVKAHQNCFRCNKMKHEQESTPIMLHYQCYMDNRFYWFKWGIVWGIMIGIIIAILLVEYN